MKSERVRRLQRDLHDGGPPSFRAWRSKSRKSNTRSTARILVSPRLEIPRLGRGERREQAAVGFQVDERRPVEAVEAPDQERRPPRARPDRPAPCRSGSGERASAAKTCRASHHHWPDFGARDRAATRAANREPRSARTPRSRPAPATQGSATSMRQIGPSARPWRGQSRREVQGVRIIPMNVSPASNDVGRFDRDLVSPDFVQPHHDPDAPDRFTRPRSRATSFRPPCRS